MYKHKPMKKQRQMSHPMAGYSKTDDSTHLHPSKHKIRKQTEVVGNAPD